MVRTLLRWWIALLSVAWLCGCGEREAAAPNAAEPTDESAAVEMSPEEVPAVPEMPAPAPIDRAEILGFARYIPAEAEALVTFHHAKKGVERVREMELWAAIGADEPGRPFEAPEVDPEFDDLRGLLHEEEEEFAGMETMPALDFLGTEVTVALGKGSTGRIASWLDFNRRSTYHQMRRVAAALTEDPSEAHPAHPEFGGSGLLFGALSSLDLYPDLIADPIASGALDTFQMPSIYFAVRAPDDRVREAHEMLSQSIGIMTFFGEMVAPVEAVRAGSEFRGYRLIGSDIAESMEEGREYMDESLGADVIDRLIEFLSSRELVALSGIIDDYAVVYLGPSVDEFEIADTPEKSITHGDALAFADPHLTHPFRGLLLGEKDLLQAVFTSASGIANIAEGLRDGLAANDRDGRSRDLVALLNLVATRERSLQALTRHETTGVTIVEDGGLRIESQGGVGGMLDYASPARFAALGDAPDVAMFLNVMIDEDYRTRSTAYYEALFETSYAMLTRLMERSPPDGGDFGIAPLFMVREYAALFESDFRADLVNLWRATAHDMANGLGRESAYVVDFKGTMPIVPGVPESLIEQAKTPRITMVAPVVEREPLAAAWEKMQESGSRIVERVGTMREREMIMPRPIHSESDGLSSWFLPLPVFSDEFLPSVTLNDEWFAMGTSRNQSVELINQLDALEPRTGGGLHFLVNFGIIAEYQREQLAVLDAHRDAILESGIIDAESYDKKREQAEAVAAAMEELETLEMRCWEEGGQARSRIHLRVRTQ